MTSVPNKSNPTQNAEPPIKNQEEDDDDDWLTEFLLPLIIIKM